MIRLTVDGALNTVLVLCIATPIATAIAITILYNFPLLLKPPRVIDAGVAISGPAIVVSDVHIGSRKSYYTLLGKLLKRLKSTALIVAGDLLDERVPLSSFVSSLKSAVEILGLERGSMVYVVSTAGHDVYGYFEKPLHLVINGVDIHIVSDVARIHIDGCGSYILVTHGEHISRDGVAAHLLDRLGVALLGKPITPILMRRTLRGRELAWIFLGHSHIPFTDFRARVANMGSWDDRVYAPAEPLVGIISCVGGRPSIEFIELPLKS